MSRPVEVWLNRHKHNTVNPHGSKMKVTDKLAVGTKDFAPAGEALTVIDGMYSDWIKIGHITGEGLTTDPFRKFSTIRFPHSNNKDEEDCCAMAVESNGSDNVVVIGGGHSELNAASGILLRVAADDTTLNGSNIWSMTSGQSTCFNVLKVAASGTALDIDNNATISGVLTCDGTGTTLVIDDTADIDTLNVTGTGTALNVTNDATVGGVLTMTGGFDSNAASTVDSLTVDGTGTTFTVDDTADIDTLNVTGTGTALNVDNDATVGGALTMTGGFDANSASTVTSLTVDGAGTALNVDNDAEITGDVTANAYYGDGSNLTGISTTSPYEQMFHVRDEKASGTDGGDFTSGGWRTRDLNTTKTNDISASLSSNQVTLPAGTYYVDGHAKAFKVNNHQTRLRNVTDGSDTIIGTIEQCKDSADSAGTRSFLKGKFTIASQKTFELQHICDTTNNGNGFGNGSNFGKVNTYSELVFFKV